MNQSENRGTMASLSTYDEISRRSDKLNLLLKGTDISTERFIYAFQSEWNRNPRLQNCSKDSLTQTIMRCAEMGLLPGIGAYIIPYDTMAQMQVSLQGWLTLLWRSGNVENITNNLYRKGDEFSYCIEHMGIKFSHKPKLEMQGEILGSYAMITLKNHQVQFKYCSLQEINASKEASKSKKPDSPWIKNFDQMAKIVPLRKLARLVAPSLHAWHSEEAPLYHPEPVSQMLEISTPSIIEAEIMKANSNQIDTIRTMCDTEQLAAILKWANIKTIYDLSDIQADKTIARLQQKKNDETAYDKILSEQSIEFDDKITDSGDENKTLYGNISIPKTETQTETFNERASL